MSSPDSCAAPKPPKRPDHGSRHGSSWIGRLHRHHDRKRHGPTEEQEPLLAANDPDSDDVEAQESPVQPQSPFAGSMEAAKQWIAEAMTNSRQKLIRASQASKRTISRNWKPLLVACVLTLLTLVISLAVGFYFHRKALDMKSVCTTAVCVHAAASILDNLDPSYSSAILQNLDSTISKPDACTDFNQLACGGFDALHDLRPDQSDMFTGTLMVENSQTILRHILESDASGMSSADRHNFEKLKADYNACMDESTIKDNGLQPLKSITDKVKTLFPILSKAWKVSPVFSGQHVVAYGGENELTETLLYLMKLGVNTMLSMGVGADDKEPDTQVIFVSPPWSIGLPSKEYYEDKKVLADYEDMASHVMDNFYSNSTSNATSQLQKSDLIGSSSGLMKEVVAFETQLAALTPPEEDLNDITKTYNPMTPAELSKWVMSEVDFKRIISKLSPSGYSAHHVIVSSPPYLKGLSKLLETTPRETLQAYLVWKVIQRYSSRIEDPALKPLKRFNNKLQGKDPEAVEERWRTCIKSADSDLGWILSKFFVDSAFSPSAKKFGDQIVTDIKDSFVDILDDAEWMTNEVRKRSINKVHAIDQKIGYPTSNPDIMDPDALQGFYKTLAISNTTYFENAVHVATFETKQEWEKLGKPTRHDEWGMTIPTVNAYYNPAGNEIVFPAGIMQHPVFYDPSVPKYLSYGAFGAVAGHELSHAFDNTGSQYDETGRYSNWWDNETRAAFEDKTQCYVDQYAKFAVPSPNGPLHVNGKLTLGENVADAGGIHASFSAWKKREAETPSQALPGLEMFTNDQLFFINYANWWCGKSTEEAAIERIYLDPHAPKWARILGTMANSAEFKKAFNCPTKEPTCALW